MIKTTLRIPPEVEDLLDGFNDGEIEEILLDAADGYCGPGGVLEKHWERGQNEWGDPDEDYLDRKEREHGSKEKFVKTGAAKAALTGESPYLVKKVFRSGGVTRIEVGLVRMEGGRNVYSIAQAGGRNGSGPPMRITDELPGDDEIIVPYVEASIKRALTRKGVL